MPGFALTNELRHTLAFYVGTPVLIGLVIGLGQPGPPYFAVPGVDMLYAMLSTLVVWISNWLCTAGAAVACRPWQPKLTTVLTVGAILGGIVWLPVRVVVNLGFLPLLAPGEAFSASWPPDDIDRWLRYCIGGSLTWVIAHQIHFHGFRVARFGYQPAGGSTLGSAGQPANSEIDPSVPEELPELPPDLRLPQELKRIVMSAQSLEHYCRLYTLAGPRLVRLPFFRLLLELSDQPGLRVHRSWWIREEAVAQLRRTDGEWSLLLKCGRQVPVSRSYRAFVEDRLLTRRSLPEA